MNKSQSKGIGCISLFAVLFTVAFVTLKLCGVMQLHG